MWHFYCGLSLVFANVSTLAMSQTQDKAHGSAVMNFINMGMATIIVFGAGQFVISSLLLPIIFISLMAIIGLIFIAFR
jgi:DHA1 family bicyclomycin/chloramphenicol resistance-like MFS transporter